MGRGAFEFCAYLAAAAVAGCIFALAVGIVLLMYAAGAPWL